MDFDFKLPGLGRPESSRPKRVGEVIRNELSVLLLKKTRDPRLQDVSFTEVSMSPDLKRANVYFVVAAGADSKSALKGLERAKGFFRSQLARSLNLRYTPELVFRYNKQNENIERLDTLFQEIAKDKKSDDHSI